LRGAGTYFRRLFTAYNLEIFSAFGSGYFKYVAAALVMALKQWGLGLKIFYISKIKLSYKNYSKKALLLCPKTSVKGVAAGPVKKALR
jgi:hypothetical protein